jgi:hypothetical protein
MDAGAPKDQSNKLGWTPLHEACFYNRIDTVKTLMLSGADASKRSRNGAMPYHLAGLQMIRDMLKDMGGQDAVPAPGDEIDMVVILRELTMTDATIIYADANGELLIIFDHNCSVVLMQDAVKAQITNCRQTDLYYRIIFPHRQ